MKFEDVAMGVDTMTGEDDFRYLDGVISAAGRICVYTLDGTLLLHGYDTLPTSDLPEGTYVVKTEGHTVKIAK